MHSYKIIHILSHYIQIISHYYVYHDMVIIDKIRDHSGARYRDILPSFCQISHTFDQREILLSHNILKYFFKR